MFCSERYLLERVDRRISPFSLVRLTGSKLCTPLDSFSNGFSSSLVSRRSTTMGDAGSPRVDFARRLGGGGDIGRRSRLLSVAAAAKSSTAAVVVVGCVAPALFLKYVEIVVGVDFASGAPARPSAASNCLLPCDVGCRANVSQLAVSFRPGYLSGDRDDIDPKSPSMSSNALLNPLTASAALGDAFSSSNLYFSGWKSLASRSLSDFAGDFLSAICPIVVHSCGASRRVVVVAAPPPRASDPPSSINASRSSAFAIIRSKYSFLLTSVAFAPTFVSFTLAIR